jgi:hypothetical protein
MHPYTPSIIIRASLDGVLATFKPFKPCEILHHIRNPWLKPERSVGFADGVVVPVIANVHVNLLQCRLPLEEILETRALGCGYFLSNMTPPEE